MKIRDIQDPEQDEQLRAYVSVNRKSTMCDNGHFSNNCFSAFDPHQPGANIPPRLGSQCSANAKADVLSMTVVTSGYPKAGSRPNPLRSVLPRATARNAPAVIAPLNPCRSISWGIVVIVVPSVLAPLPHVAIHVEKSECICRKRPNR